MQLYMLVRIIDMKKSIKFLIMNIGNPSLERAQKQVEWIKNRDEDVFFLTETKNSKGCNYIANSFSCSKNLLNLNNVELNVSFPKSITGDYGVMCISKYQIVSSNLPFGVENQYHCRYLENDISINNEFLKTVSLYVPSRDSSYEKIIRKKNFLELTLENIKRIGNIPTIICGDLNIIDRNHIPSYSSFKKWEYEFYDNLVDIGFIDLYRYCHPQKNEYSWVGRTGDGYRYDYCFVSKSLSNRIIDCRFVHETRNNKLTDHSALVVEMEIV